jgi:phosphomannomutase
MEPGKTYTHLFFDLDNTVTRSRSLIAPEMQELMSTLSQDLIIISGASVDQIRYQMNGVPCYVMGQNGNHCVQGTKDLWRDELTALEIAEIEAHIASLKRTWDVPNENDLIENRGSQVSYSIYGHHAPVADKEAFDPDQAKRRTMLAASPLISETIEVKIAGTTCLDYFRKGRNKGFNVARLIEHEGWNKDECIYFGDAIYPGGNDETVYGVIETQGVQNPQDTYERLTAFK